MTTQTKVFKLKVSSYQLSFAYGHWSLRIIKDGKPHNKTELTNKNIESVFSYLAKAERCTSEEVRDAYENA